ncbi:hypothetical protein PLESTB_000662500 [Pleodorina starrii]|uniref:Uncharacterized protein n=1 Tax=Pleodorina starrii TaxID=330485 RepID=A0A9W6F1C1_9CHLO|nr:hypothetical protein PLESTB_000662500 [Pleodorina starrii]
MSGRIVAATATAAAGAHVAAETHVNNAAVRENAAAATRVHSAAAAATRADAAAGVAPMATDTDEVLKLNVPPPKLNIPIEGKLNVRAAADATRVFVRDVKKFFPLVKGGHIDEVRCLFLGSALDGLAKRYHDEWTLAQTSVVYLWRKENNRCLACGAKTHGVSACSNPAWLRRKAENDAAAAAAGGSGDGKAKGKRGHNRGKGN